ncbi:MAG TPA: S8 family peptidase, partial [Herpetosiphonaceae bacterium]
PNQYIVVLKDGPRISAGSVAQSVGATPKYTYDAALNGFAATLNPGQLKALQKHPNVAYIEQDAEVSIQAAQPDVSIQTAQPVSGGQWGLDRIDEPTLPLDGFYNYNATASNVTVYLIDTGINISHWEFAGRAAVAYDALGGNGIDCNGNATYQQGVIGSVNYGVAKAVQMRGVRVLNCSGSGTTSSVLSGMNWVAANAVSPAVVNINLGMAGPNATVNAATTNMVNAGKTVVVSAGSNNANACNYSPASAAGVLTVAGSMSNDNRAPFSNFGQCVELYAPAGTITTTSINGGYATISGTSMSASFTSGVAALYLSGNPAASPAVVNNWITTNATPGVIIGNILPTPNLLLYKSNL